MPKPHEQLIANAAKRTLRPLGFRRKGRSRIWVLDGNWWLNVVEFQPSAWAKGSYLNVNAHCLWSEQDYISYEYGGRLEPFSDFKSEAQFAEEADHLARSAAYAARELSCTFETIRSAAAALTAKEEGLGDEARGSWSAYHAGIAMGLAGKWDEAAALFHSIKDDRVQSAAARFEGLIITPDRFRHEVGAVIAAHRKVLGLAPDL